MEVKLLINKASTIVKKYRFVLLILAIGIVLMTLPSTNKTTKTTLSTNNTRVQSADTIEEELTQVLRQIKGVGEVRLLLTIETNSETVYQTDRDCSSNESGQSTQSETVIITDADRNQNGLERKKNAPTYRGAVVVCGGGDNPAVQLAVTKAVMTSTGLSADQVCVLKMK